MTLEKIYTPELVSLYWLFIFFQSKITLKNTKIYN